MGKFVAFNIGGALCCYFEYDKKKIMFDIGSGNSFSPTNDFLLPLFLERKETKVLGKFQIDQLFISHPQNDHISDIENFYEYFNPYLLTMPNSNPGTPENEKIEWDLIANQTSKYVDFLKKEVLPGRNPPLKPFDPAHIKFFYIKSKDCLALSKTNYANNLSIQLIFRYKDLSIMICGDMMKDGMEYLIDTNTEFSNELKSGISHLIAPHHGLRSSFSTKLFESMKNKKTKSLNIISEKPNNPDDPREVDSRYSTEDYCQGINNLSTTSSPVYQRKTSTGHICIDFSSQHYRVEIFKDNRELINYFIK